MRFVFPIPNNQTDGETIPKKSEDLQHETWIDEKKRK